LASSNPPDLKRLVPWINYLIFFAVLNETVFNVSTIKVQEQYGLTEAGVSWMMTVFMVCFAIGMVVFGRLSDLFAARRLVLIGILTYAAGSLAGFLLQFSYPLVLASRAVQGVGCSAIPALVFAMVAKYYEPGERGRLFGFITSTVSFSVALGPVIGGLVSGTLHWSFLFLIPLATLAAIPAFRRILPREARKAGGVDLMGGALVAATVAGLVLFLNLGDWRYGFGALAAFAGLLARLFTAREPFIDPSLFRNGRYVVGVVAAGGLFTFVLGAVFMIPLLLKSVHGLEARGIGLVLFPGALIGAFLGPWGGSLADRRGNPFVIATGFLLLALGLSAMGFFLAASPWVILVALVPFYVGFAFSQTALVNSVTQVLSPEKSGTGMGVFNLLGTLAGAVGMAFVGKILTLHGRGAPLFEAFMLAFALGLLALGGLFLWTFRKRPVNAE